MFLIQCSEYKKIKISFVYIKNTARHSNRVTCESCDDFTIRELTSFRESTLDKIASRSDIKRFRYSTFISFTPGGSSIVVQICSRGVNFFSDSRSRLSDFSHSCLTTHHSTCFSSYRTRSKINVGPKKN